MLALALKLACGGALAPYAAADELTDGEVPSECNGPGDAPASRLVIIIDDIGLNRAWGEDALDLHGRVTYAVIPFSGYGRELAEAAHLRGKEVMLHAPMSTVDNTPLGIGGLTPALSREEFRATLQAALSNIPHARGVNNHMGSDLTQRRLQMAWLMQELRWHDLYFVDSRTTGKSVAADVAAQFNVPHLRRRVFLDNERSAEAIDERFQVLLGLAAAEGLAVGIAHPYPETVAYLREALPQVEERGVQLVTVSEALAAPSPATEQEAGSATAQERAADAAHCRRADRLARR